MGKNLNNDVPEETTLRYVLMENGKLKSEIEYLEHEINRLHNTIDMQNKAIKDFKKWQSRVAQYKWDYWLNEGFKLMENLPSQELIDALRRLFCSHANMRRFVKKIDSLYNNLLQAEKAMEKFKS